VADTRRGEERLYDLDSDPAETRDLASAMPVRIAAYTESLRYWLLRQARARPVASGDARLTPEQCRNLQALGYVDGECP